MVNTPPSAEPLSLAKKPVPHTLQHHAARQTAAIHPKPKPASVAYDQHGHSMPFRCSKPKGIPLKKQTIYYWVDEHGQTHFSDQAQHTAALQKQLETHERFVLELDATYASLPAFAIDRIKRDINSLYHLLADEWGLPPVAAIRFKLKLFDQEKDFRDYQQKVAPSLGNPGGFYVHHLSEASVLTQGNTGRTYEVTRHEAMHAINAQAFGRIPTWLNEGLAEYAEKHRFQYGSHYINAGHPTHLKRLRRQPKINLTSYFQLNRRDWYSRDAEQLSLHYATAWSLVYWLRSSRIGKEVLSQLLNHLSDHYCTSIDTVKWFEGHYPGGMAALQDQWRQFIDRDLTPHHY